VEIPWATEPYSEIIPGLWMGGHYRADRDDQTLGVPVKVTDEFGLVVSLFQTDLHDCGPDRGIPEIVFRIPDGPLDKCQRRVAQDLANLIVHALSGNLKVLVRCQAGYNRSGLVVAYALMALDFSPIGAVLQVREKRSFWALCNSDFLDYLEEDDV
jgi:Predicted protein-tyrosine phosphatase